jgi:hypothetical protein
MHEGKRRGGNCPSVNPGLAQLLVRAHRRRQGVHGQLGDARGLVTVAERGEHGITQATFWPVIFDVTNRPVCSAAARSAAVSIGRLGVVIPADLLWVADGLITRW